MERYDVIVIGGGLAGCSAAAQLARQGRRVLLAEKRTYPAHRLCGEFLSPEVQAAFRHLGVGEAVEAAGPHAIRRTRITTAGGPTFEAPLPGTALGLSRYALDRLLAQHAERQGADVRMGVTVRAVEGTLEDGFRVTGDDLAAEARVVLGAYGKRGLLDRKLGRPFLQEDAPFVGFKAHFTGIDVPETIELHAFPGGYCGLSHVEGGRTNACWIATVDALKADGGSPEAMIAGSLARNPYLAERLQAGERVTDFCAVSQVTFAHKGTFVRDVCMIGDTVGMIAPMCGDGMAMALHSAEVAVPLVAAYLDGEADAGTFRRGYDRVWRRTFALRMRLGRGLHHAYIRPGVAEAAVRATSAMPWVGRWLIRKTRG